MKRVGNLFDQVTDFRNLLHAYRQSARGKRGRKYVREFSLNLEENLWRIKFELEKGKYTWSEYKTFEVHDSKRRTVVAPAFRDRIVHHALCNVIEPIFDRTFIAHSFACRAGKGTLAGVKAYETFIHAFRQPAYVLKCDIRKYFPSIDHEILFGLIQKKIKDSNVLNLLRSLIFAGDLPAEVPTQFGRRVGTQAGGKGIPIGNLTSQLFANVYLNELDHYVKEGLRVRHYLRYMDDFMIVHEDRGVLRELRGKMDVFLKDRLLLTLHPGKRHIWSADRGVSWLGYRVFPGYRKRIRTGNVVKFRRRLKNLERAYREGKIDIAVVRSSVASWFGLSKHADAYGLSLRIFRERDIQNLGKYFLCRSAARP